LTSSPLSPPPFFAFPAPAIIIMERIAIAAIPATLK